MLQDSKSIGIMAIQLLKLPRLGLEPKKILSMFYKKKTELFQIASSSLPQSKYL